MKPTEFYRELQGGESDVKGGVTSYTMDITDLSSEYVRELVNRTTLLHEFNMTLEEFWQSNANIKLGLEVTDKHTTAHLWVETDGIRGAGYGLPLLGDELEGVRTALKSRPLMQRLLEAGYPPEDIDHHESDLYVYVTPLTTRIINEWCKDNGYNRDHFCSVFKDTITERQMYYCEFQYIAEYDERKPKAEKHGKDSSDRKKLDVVDR